MPSKPPAKKDPSECIVVVASPKKHYPWRCRACGEYPFGVEHYLCLIPGRCRELVAARPTHVPGYP
eukprot:8165656-Alexandrium_andersonii.AAC.1